MVLGKVGPVGQKVNRPSRTRTSRATDWKKREEEREKKRIRAREIAEKRFAERRIKEKEKKAKKIQEAIEKGELELREPRPIHPASLHGLMQPDIPMRYKGKTLYQIHQASGGKEWLYGLKPSERRYLAKEYMSKVGYDVHPPGEYQTKIPEGADVEKIKEQQAAQWMLPVAAFKEVDVDGEKYLQFRTVVSKSYVDPIKREKYLWRQDPVKYNVGAFFSEIYSTDMSFVESALYKITGQEEKLIMHQHQLRTRFEGDLKAGPVKYLTGVAMSFPSQVLMAKGVGAGMGYVSSAAKARFMFTAPNITKKISIGEKLLLVPYAASVATGGYERYQQKGWEGLVTYGISQTGLLHSGIQGYKYGAPRGYEKGAFSGYRAYVKQQVKLGKITPEMGKVYIEQSRIEQQLGKMLGSTKTQAQRELSWETVETFKEPGGQKAEFYLKRLSARHKGEIFGSLAERTQTMSDFKTSSHDIDIMFKKYGRVTLESQYGGKQLKIEISQFGDIKVSQRPGQIVGLLGARKQQSIMDITGKWKIMGIGESAQRHGQSSLFLAHEGRIKDIPRATDLYLDLFGQAPKSVQKKTLPLLEQYLTQAELMYQKPLVMSPELSMSMYGSPNTTQVSRWQQFKIKTLEKVLPESYWQKSFTKTMGLDMPTTKTQASFAKSILPPSPTTPAAKSPAIGSPLPYGTYYDVLVGEQGLTKSQFLKRTKIQYVSQESLEFHLGEKAKGNELFLGAAQVHPGRKILSSGRPKIWINEFIAGSSMEKVAMRHEFLHQLHPRWTEKSVQFRETTYHGIIDPIIGRKLPSLHRKAGIFPSISPSPSKSKSISKSISQSLSISPSPSKSKSISKSISQSLSLSTSPSPSRSLSLSTSPSPSRSLSLSTSPSPSKSISKSVSKSVSPLPQFPSEEIPDIMYIKPKKKKKLAKGSRRRKHPVTLFDIDVLPKGVVNII